MPSFMNDSVMSNTSSILANNKLAIQSSVHYCSLGGNLSTDGIKQAKKQMIDMILQVDD